MPLPSPSQPAGSVVISCQVNIEGHAPAQIILPAQIGAKLLRFLSDSHEFDIVDGCAVRKPRFSGIGPLFEQTVVAELVTMLNRIYP